MVDFDLAHEYKAHRDHLSVINTIATNSLNEIFSKYGLKRRL